MHRREFGLTLAGATAAMALGWRISTGAAQRLDIGIGSYTFHALSIEDMIPRLQRLRITEIELSHGEFMLFSHPADDRVRAVRALLDAAGIRCVSYYSATIATDSDVEAALRIAALLGAPNVTGDATGPILDRIDTRFTHEGRTFGIHNHFFKQGFAYESPEDVLRAISTRSPSVGASLDVGHMASCGHDPVDAVRKLAPRLKIVHLKDVQASGGEVNVLLGRGIARIPDVMKALQAVSYRGLVAIEYEKDGSVDDDVRTEVDYARGLA